MLHKKTVMTKTFWGAIAAIATGVGLIFAGEVPEGILLIFGGIQTIFLRDSNTKMERKES